MEAILLLRVNAQMRGARKRRTRLRRARHGTIELAAEFFLHEKKEFFDAHLVEHVFEPRLGAVGAVAMVDEHAYHRIGHFGRVGGFDQHAGVAGEAQMPGKAAKAEPEPDARRQAEAVLHHDRLEANVIGVFEHGNNAGAVEADIELSRQAIERAVVENVEMPFARVGPCVDQFLADRCRRLACR